MIKLINGDIFDQQYRNSQTCIVHQCNCIAAIPHGLSKNIADQFGSYANTYERRRKLSRNIAVVHDRPTPGSIDFCDGSPHVVALFAQFLFGKPPSSVKYKFTDSHINKGIAKDTEENRLRYFERALTNFKKYLIQRNNNSSGNDTIDTIVFPYNIGCGLAGGNWKNYRKKIKNFARKLQDADEQRKYTILIIRKE